MSINDNRKTFEELECGDSVYVINGNTQSNTNKSIVEFCVLNLNSRNYQDVIILPIKEFHGEAVKQFQCVDGFILCSNFAALSNYIEKINNDYSKLANELILDRADYLEYLRLKNEQRS
jgi:hypothetical protein